MTTTALATLIFSVTAYVTAKVAEVYVKKYHPDVWDELNRWEG